MAEWEKNRGETDEWYTPREIFDALGVIFDLDPCSPGAHHWVPAWRVYTKADDGLLKPWEGIVFVNPPFGGRNGQVPWLKKFVEHGNGICIVRAYTSAAWFQSYAPRMDAMLFPTGKTKFWRSEGELGDTPGHGSVMFSKGETATAVLKDSGLGLFLPISIQTRRGSLL